MRIKGSGSAWVASLVQIYTGFIYNGPALIQDAVQAIKATQ